MRSPALNASTVRADPVRILYCASRVVPAGTHEQKAQDKQVAHVNVPDELPPPKNPERQSLQPAVENPGLADPAC